MSISPQGLFRYFKELLKKEKIVNLLAQSKYVFAPCLCIVPSCGIQWGGVTYDSYKIEISSWILSNASIAKGVIRHEVAHAIQEHLNIEGRPHGKEWLQILKTVSPSLWRKDRHWQPKADVMKARNQIHIKGKTLQDIRKGGVIKEFNFQTGSPRIIVPWRQSGKALV